MDVWSTERSVMGVASDRRPLSRDFNDPIETPTESPAPPAVRSVNPAAPPGEIRLYPQRWYILILYSLTTFMQGAVWNTWGPLSTSAKAVFGWKDSDIILLSNWGPITFVISAPFFAWLLDVKGLRISCIITGALVAGGAGLRCITSSNPAATWLIHIGQVLNGIGGPVCMGAAPLISAVWFPVHQRTTATAIATIFNALGTAISFIIGPLLVPERSNATSSSMSVLPMTAQNVSDIELIKLDIMKLMYIEFGVSAAVFLLILIYFPKKPLHPPSLTASMERLDFKNCLKPLFRNIRFWTLAAPYALSMGVFACWGSVLDVNLSPKGISEDTAGWLGFYSSIAGNAASLGIGWFADVFKRRMKLYMLILYTGASISFFIFTLAYENVLPLTTALLFSSLILAGLFTSAPAPLFYELCCETTYPVAEGVTNTLLTWLNNLLGLIFLLVIPYLPKAWMNWIMTASVVICIPVLCFVKERYTRLDIDIHESSES